MILSIFELDILLDGLKDQYGMDFYTKSGKNKQTLADLDNKLKEVRNEMVDKKLMEWEMFSDEERGQRIIRPKYDGAILTDDFAIC